MDSTDSAAVETSRAKASDEPSPTEVGSQGYPAQEPMPTVYRRRPSLEPGAKLRCHRYRVRDIDALRNLNQFYHNNVANIPGFLMRAIYPTSDEPNLWDLAAFVNNPHLFARGQVDLAYGSQGYLLMPNIERHQDKTHLMCSKDEAKRHLSKENGGISYTIWALHPHVMGGQDKVLDMMRTVSGGLPCGARSSPFCNSFDLGNVEDVEDALFSAQPSLGGRMDSSLIQSMTPSHGQSSTCGRLNSQKRACQIEQESGQKYLVSMLDLTDAELPWLLKVREHSIEHMAKYYGYRDVDYFELFFHFPTGFATSTLHLHATLCKEYSPIERARSFRLDEIIAHLGSGNCDVFDLVYQRQCTSPLSGLISASLTDVMAKWEEETSADDSPSWVSMTGLPDIEGESLSIKRSGIKTLEDMKRACEALPECVGFAYHPFLGSWHPKKKGTGFAPASASFSQKHLLQTWEWHFMSSRAHEAPIVTIEPGIFSSNPLGFEPGSLKEDENLEGRYSSGVDSVEAHETETMNVVVTELAQTGDQWLEAIQKRHSDCWVCRQGLPDVEGDVQFMDMNANFVTSLAAIKRVCESYPDCVGFAYFPYTGYWHPKRRGTGFVPGTARFRQKHTLQTWEWHYMSDRT